MNSFFPTMAFFLALGRYLGSFIHHSVKIVLALSFLLFFLLLWSLLQRGRLSHILLVLLVVLLGLFRYQLQWQRTSHFSAHGGKEVVVAGIIVQEPDLGEERHSFIVKVDTIQTSVGGIRATERVLIESWHPQDLELAYGDRVEVVGRVSFPDPPANFGGFNYKSYLMDQGIRCIIQSNKGGITLISRDGGNRLFSLAIRVKEKMLAVIDKSLPSPQREVLAGLLLGQRDTLKPEILRQIEVSGVLHLLAVSGLHVGFVAGLAYSLGLLFNLTPRIGAVVSGAAAGFYLLLVGFRASVLRAGIMLWFGIIGVLLRRRSQAIVALSIAGLILLWIRPGLLFTPGFQLSFAATGGILYLFLPLRKILPPLHPWLGSSLAVSMAAQLSTWPILAYHFQGFSTYAVFNNLLSVPLAGAIMSLGLISCGVGLFILPLAQILGAANNILITLFLRFTALTAALPGAYPYVPPPQPPFLLAYYAFLLLLPGSLVVPNEVLRGKGNSMGYQRSLIILLTCLLVFWGIIPSLGPGRLEVTFLSVGAGDAAVVRIMGGKTYLIDTGPGGDGLAFDAGSSVVVPFLKRQGINSLEYIFLSHPHADHYGGLGAITSQLAVKGLILPPGFPPQEFGLKGDLDIPLFRAEAGNRLDLGRGVQIEVLHPPADLLKGTKDDANNNSLVLLLKMGEVSFLFPGDLEAAGEEYMLQYKRVPAATVLKVGHHGARNSTGPAFLKQVNPHLAVISTGPSSSGHPHRETLERLAQMGIRTHRTDLDGAVKISTNGKRIWLQLARPIQGLHRGPDSFAMLGG